MTHEDEYRQMHLRASEPQPRTTYIVGPPAALAAYTRLIAGDSRYLVVVSDPSMPPGVVGAVRLTAEQIAATKHLKPGEAWAKAGQSLEPEPPAKVEDLDEF